MVIAFVIVEFFPDSVKPILHAALEVALFLANSVFIFFCVELAYWIGAVVGILGGAAYVYIFIDDPGHGSTAFAFLGGLIGSVTGFVVGAFTCPAPF